MHVAADHKVGRCRQARLNEHDIVAIAARYMYTRQWPRQTRGLRMGKIFGEQRSAIGIFQAEFRTGANADQFAPSIAANDRVGRTRHPGSTQPSQTAAEDQG